MEENNVDKLLIYEKELCQVSLYYIMILGKENLQSWIKILNYDKEAFEDLIKDFPKNHILIRHYNKLKTLKSEQYNNVAESLKEKLVKFYNKEQPYFSTKVVACEEDVEILSEIIVDSYEYDTMDDYLSQKLEIENDKRILYILGCILYEGRDCEENEDVGIELLEKSAQKGYPYAIYEIAKIDYNNGKNIKAIEKLNQLLEIEDEILLRKVKELLNKILYHGKNEEYGIPENKKYYIGMFERGLREECEIEKIKKGTHYLDKPDNSKNN